MSNQNSIGSKQESIARALSIGFSPCPNDTFMFDAMINGKLTHMFDFDINMGDIEELNTKAFNGVLDVTKISYHALMYLTDTYQILSSGSALGHNCGPLLLAKNSTMKHVVNTSKIAVPGAYTTANMLLELAFPNAKNKTSVLFSDIEDVILDQTYDMGLVIHENRFTYQQRGLHKIIDLGEYWEEQTQLPIPLGAIVVKRSLPEEVKQQINQLLKDSIQYAFDHPKESLTYVKDNAQAMDEEVMYQHIGLYVNEYSLDLGSVGRESVHALVDLMIKNGKIDRVNEKLFV